MTKLTRNFTAKVTAVFLLVIFALSAVFGFIMTYYMVENDFYTKPMDEIKKEIYKGIAALYAGKVFFGYFPAYEINAYNLDEYKEEFSSEKTNFLFILKNSSGETLLTNYSGEEYQLSTSYRYERSTFFRSGDSNDLEKTDVYTVECFVKKTLTAHDNFKEAEYWINFGYSNRYLIIAIALVSVIASIILFIYLMCAAGRRKGEENIILGGVDKIPFDILLAFVIIISSVTFAAFFDSTGVSDSIGAIIVISATTIINTLLAVLLFMSFAARYKAGGWWKNTITYMVLRFCIRLVGGICKGMISFARNISILWKAILGFIIVSFAELFIMSITYDNGGLLFLFWLLEKLILIPVILLLILNLRKLQVGGQKIAEGDLNYKIDTRHMFWDFKRHGENLNSIGNGMAKAVNERLKSEKFKTELITNVSHDIKTPLTSIINYVDLLKKEVTEEGTIKEYIDVLDRQSARLKKLTDDIVEASKASTGNMSVNMERTEVGLLLEQAVGEYEEKIKGSGLELILTKPEKEIFIMADGRLLWRVFDNLLSNICKYSHPGTRAYLNLEINNGEAVIIFRNVSKYPLNISSEELFERFVRGDSSRNTEGSGLGLSIAKSLTELQKGKMEIYIDGDLFKVILKFNTIGK